MLRQNMWTRSVDECFADAPSEVRAAVAELQFRRREHPPVNVIDLYADLCLVGEDHATSIVSYMLSLGMDADVPAYLSKKRDTYFDGLPQ